jgi:hypothetical protein
MLNAGVIGMGIGEKHANAYQNHCNANLKEMNIVAENSPKVDSFILKKTSQFYKILG